MNQQIIDRMMRNKSLFKDFIRKKMRKVIIDGNEHDLASFDRRLIAGSLDAVLMTLVMHPLALFAEKISGLASKRQQIIDSAPVPVVNESDIANTIANAINNNLIDTSVLVSFIVYQLIMLLLAILVVACFWDKKSGQTPGKMLLRCRIIDADTGGKISKKQIIIRVLAMIPSISLLGLGLLGVGLSKRRRSFHDWAANTVVILEPKIDKVTVHKAANSH